MRFHICYRNKKYKIEIEDNNANIVEIQEMNTKQNSASVEFKIYMTI